MISILSIYLLAGIFFAFIFRENLENASLQYYVERKPEIAFKWIAILLIIFTILLWPIGIYTLIKNEYNDWK